MTTAFDNWGKPQGQDQRVSALTPFGQYTQQQGQNNYQSIPKATAQTAAATKTGTLNMNKQASYLSYLDQVVGGTLPSDEGSLRAGYIPKNEGTAGYSGSGYVDRNVKMAPNAIPSAYNYADIAKNQNPYGMNQLIWGGPSSGKTSNPLDYVPYSTLTGLKGNANSFLQNALIPDNLAGDVSNNLYGKWMQNWDGKFDQMASDRAAEQQAWWAGSDWANKSTNPAWNEVISPAIPDIPEVPFRPAIYNDVAAQHNLISPEVQGRDAIAGGYYTPSQKEYNDWQQQDYNTKYNDTWTQKNSNTGETFSFPFSQATEWQDEFQRHEQNLRDAYPFWQNRLGLWNLDPTSPNNAFYQNEQSWGGTGQIKNHFTNSGTGTDAFNNTFQNTGLGVNVWGHTTDTLNFASIFPEQWGNYQAGQDAIPYQEAIYEDIPGRHDLVSPEQFARPGIPGIPQVDFYHPQTKKLGYDTVLDPITGMEIPNWYQGGSFGSNSALQAAYGAPAWYLQ